MRRVKIVSGGRGGEEYCVQSLIRAGQYRSGQVRTGQEKMVLRSEEEEKEELVHECIIYKSASTHVRVWLCVIARAKIGVGE